MNLGVSESTPLVKEEIERYTELLRVVYLTRLVDEKMQKLIRQNKGGTFHISVLGHEMIGAVCALHLVPGKDWGLPYYRDRAFAVGLGCSVHDLLAASLARSIPHHSGGRMMPEHFSHRQLRIPCQSSCVGSQFLQAVGVAKAMQLAKEDAVVYVSAGDGATSQGDFHEALNFACLHRLGVIFVIQDNGWAISVPSHEQTTGGSVARWMKEMPGLFVAEIDGCDHEQIERVMEQAVARGRLAEGPTLVMAKVPRIGAHSSSDDPTKYQRVEAFEEERGKDPVPRFERWLMERGVLSLEEMERLKQSCFEEVEKQAALADQLPFPDASTAATGVFQEDGLQLKILPPTTQETVVMMDALNHALDEEMERDERVVVFGQDVAHGKGGVFGITRRLTEKHGAERCFNSPLAESSIIGIAMGMGMAGFRPVAEIQFADYMWTGVNQLMNELASLYYRANGEWSSSVVIRMPYGGYIQGGPYHSQSPEAHLAHAPGLKVVIPSNAEDAKRLLKAAIRDPNPVVFLEHKALYRQRVFCARREPLEEEIEPLGIAKVIREGGDATLVCWGMTAFLGMQVAEKLAKEGLFVEVIDLRTIIPFDGETVLASVKKTGKLLVAHEAARTSGFGAEVCAHIVENGFDYLDAPVQRVTGKDCPIPYCKTLEDAVLPQAEDIEHALRNLCAF